jgi:hypothetical protein
VPAVSRVCWASEKQWGTHLHIACAPVKVQMEILDYTIIRKFVFYVVFCGFFMNTGDEDDPPLDGCRVTL